MSKESQHSNDIAMADGAHQHGTATTVPQKDHNKPKPEVRKPVLLQWKDREMADDLSKLMMNSTGSEKNNADTTGGDVEMEDR